MDEGWSLAKQKARKEAREAVAGQGRKGQPDGSRPRRVREHEAERGVDLEGLEDELEKIVGAFG